MMPATGRFKQPPPVHPVRDREGTYYAGEEPYQSQAWYERLVSATLLPVFGVSAAAPDVLPSSAPNH